MNDSLHSPGSGRARWSRVWSLVLIGLVGVLVAGCSGGAGGQQSAPPPPPTVLFDPGNGAQGVSPTAPITATAQHGRIVDAVLTNPEGERVEAAVAPDGASWSAAEPLGYGKTYKAAITVQGAVGAPVTQEASFTTVDPADQTYVSMNPLDGQTVGVGQPLAFYFSEDAPAPDKAKAEQAIRIRTEPAVEGAFYWIDSREVHWRPKEYWQPGTEITVDADVYGKDLGNGVWGEENRTATFHIGDAVVLKADGASHQMSINVNGVEQRTIPVSLGKPSFPSNDGTHVVTEHHATKLMDSSTYGLPVDQGGYQTEVKWAVRISNSGEFLHAAPWSVADQGKRNVSHGCINMSNADAKAVYDLLKKGDVVEITNSGGPELKSTNGFGDWQVPWDEWLSGNR